MILGAIAIRSVPLQLPPPDRVRRGVVGFPEHLPEVEGTHAFVIVIFVSALVAVGGGRRSLLVGRVGTEHLAKVRRRLHVRGGRGTAPFAAGEKNQVTSGKGQVKRGESRSSIVLRDGEVV